MKVLKNKLFSSLAKDVEIETSKFAILNEKRIHLNHRSRGSVYRAQDRIKEVTSMAMEYSPKVMEHFMNPHNVGEIEDADGIGEVGNAKCGDIMKMYIKVDDGIITDVKFKTFGCGSAIATSSMATDLIKGKPITEALKLTNQAVVEALDGLPPVKIHCSVLAEQSIKAAIADYYQRRGIDPTPIVGEIPPAESCHIH